jgi:capsule polysaccharide export protein KpsE/RkpR
MMTGTKTQTEDMDASVEMVAEPEYTLSDLGSSLLAKLRLLWNKRRYLRKAFFVGLVCGVLLAFLLPPEYESFVQLMPPDSQASSALAMAAALTAKTGGAIGGIAGDLLGIKGSGALFAGILHSRTIQDRLIDRFNLRKVYSVRLQEDARKELTENTAISEDRKNGIISVTVTDRDPHRAAEIAQAYVEELNRLVADLSTSAAHRERVFLEERLVGVKHDLDQASRDFSQFASKNKTVDIKEEAHAMLQGASALEGELIATESELKGLQAIYTDNNVRVRATQARVNELRRQLEKLGGNGPSEPSRSGDSSDSAHPSLRNLPLLGVTYADLYRRVQIQEAVFETLTQQFELAKVQEAKETPSVKVLDAANVPERKSFPPRTLITLVTALLVFGGAMIGVLVQDRWQKIDSESAGKVFADEVAQTMYAHMPWATPNGSRIQAMTHRVWIGLVARTEKSEVSNSPSK